MLDFSLVAENSAVNAIADKCGLMLSKQHVMLFIGAENMRRAFDDDAKTNSIISISSECIVSVRITNLFVELAANFQRLLAICTPILTFNWWSLGHCALTMLSRYVCGYLVGQIICNYGRSDAYKLFSSKFKLLNTWRSIEFIRWPSPAGENCIFVLLQCFRVLHPRHGLNITFTYVCVREFVYAVCALQHPERLLCQLNTFCIFPHSVSLTQ